MSYPTLLNTLTGLSVQEYANKMDDIADYLGSLESAEQVTHDIQVTNVTEWLADGLYARENKAAAGTCIVSKVHNKRLVNVISQGKVHVATREGVVTKEAPCTFLSPAGTQRLIYVEEDVVWTTIHTVDTDDVSLAEDELTTETYNQFLKLGE